MPAAVPQLPGQAFDSSQRGYLQAVDPDPLLWPLKVIATPEPNI
jgi:hypothetical protein